MKDSLSKALRLLALPVLLFPALALAAPYSELRAVGLSTTEGGARLSLDVSAVTSDSIFTLTNPYRVVIDLRNTRLAAGVRMPAGTGVVENVRTGPRPGGVLRVVLEIKEPLTARVKWFPATDDAGNQLVVAVGKGIALAREVSTPLVASVPSPSKVADDNVVSSAAAVERTPKQVKPAHAPIDSDRDIVIAVDAGHGGTDPGAIGRNGTLEKEVTLAIARALAARINSEPGMRATLIRNGDYFVVLRDRMVRARAAKADLFVSIHADAIRDRSITGASVYVLNERGASSEAARWLAERENAADLMGGVKLDDKDESLASVLLDLSQTASLTASMTAAERVLAELDRSVEVRKSRVQQAGLIVLKSPDIPSLLVETGYISNPKEESRLKSDRHQERLADTIFAGLRTYFEVNPPAGTRLARTKRSTLAGVMAGPTTP